MTEETQRAADQADALAWLEKIDDISDPLARKLLAVHDREPMGEGWGCRVCETDYGQSSWPCDTVELVTEHFGLPVPLMRRGGGLVRPRLGV